MARTLEETSQFKRDKKRIKGSGRYDWEKMRAIVKELINDRPLEQKHRDHELAGEYAGVRECHVEPDWLLIYDRELRRLGCLQPNIALQLLLIATRGCDGYSDPN